MEELQSKLKEAQADKDRLEAMRAAYNQEMRQMRDALDELQVVFLLFTP